MVAPSKLATSLHTQRTRNTAQVSENLVTLPCNSRTTFKNCRFIAQL